MDTLVRLAALLVIALSGAAAGFAQERKPGSITVTAPWARATPGGARVAGAYLEIRAPAGTSDRLIGARSPASTDVELHDIVSEGGVLKMRRVEAIEVTGDKAVVLKPGGLHLMLMGLKAPLKPGDEVEFTLIFEKAGELKIAAPVAPIGAKGPVTGGATAGSGASKGTGSGSGKGGGSGAGR